MTDTELFAKIDAFRAVQDREGFSTVWSIHEVTDIEDKVPLKNQVGRKVVFNYWDKNFNDKKVETTIKGETWLDMWRAANELVVTSGDFHIFVENFVMQEDGSFELICGS
jgi:hypothetical protein